MIENESPGAGQRRGGDGGRDDIRELDETLGAVRFTPRLSLEAEIFGRLQQKRSSTAAARSSRIRSHLLIAGRHGTVVWSSATIAAAALLIWWAGAGLWTGEGTLATGVGEVTLDHCCSDLDGGGEADDGVLIQAGEDESVLRLAIYEDRDGSGDYTPADIIRAGPDSPRSTVGPLPRGSITQDHCCRDFDAGGPADDGILLVSVPPDRVLMAAVYEDRDASGNLSAADVVRYMLP